MKKEYSTPQVEKIEFSYTESVTASWPEQSVPPCCYVPGQQYGGGTGGTGGQSEAGGTPCYWVDENKDVKSDNPYWGC